MSPLGRTTPGWYTDPYGKAQRRWFDGTEWTHLVVVDEAEFVAAATPTQSASAAAATRLATIAEELDALHTRGLLDAENHARARADVDRRLSLAQRAATVGRAAPVADTTAPAAPWAKPATTPTTPTTPPVTRHVPERTAPPAAQPAAQPVARPAVEPTPVPGWADDARTWLRDAAASVRSDLAVHGLAYLGVLLFFGGVLGFVVFAFGDVAADLRPVAELVIPLALFGAAWFLQRRGSELVGTSLELLGGALLPIVLAASFVDGAGVPPDARGSTLAWTLAAAMAVVAGVYALVARRRASTPLRFLVAPVAWLGVTFAAAITNADLTGGSTISRPGPWQMAITTAAVAATAIVVRTRRGHPIADATDAVILPGFAVTLLLGVLGAVRLGLTGGPLVLAGLAAFAVAAAQHERLGPSATAFGQLGALAAALIGVGMVTTPATAGVTGVLLFLAFVEWQGLRHAESATIEVAAIAVVGAGVAACTGTATPALLATGLLLVWALARRAIAPEWLTALVNPEYLALAATIAFGAVTVAFLDPGVALVICAALLATLAVVVRATSPLDDTTWGWWTPLLTLLVLVAGVTAVDLVGETTLTAVALMLTVPALVGTRVLAVRVWLSAATLATAAVAGGLAADVAPSRLAAGFGVVGLVFVAAAASRAPARSSRVWAHLAALGLLSGAGAIVAAFAIDARPALADGPWWAVATLALGTTAWGITALAQETHGSVVTDTLVKLFGTGTRRLAPFATIVGAGCTIVTAFHAASGTWLSGTALTAALLALALATAALTRAFAGREELAQAFVLGGTLCAATATLTALLGGEWAVTAAVVAAASATVLLIPARHRTRTMRLAAWVGTAGAWLATAKALDANDESLRGALFAWGAIATVGALTADELRHGRRAVGAWPKSFDWSSLGALGIGAMTAAWLSDTDAPPATIGWWSLVAGGVVLVIALALRAPWLSLGTYAGITAAVALLPDAQPPENLWWIVVTMTAFLGLAVALDRLLPATRYEDEDVDPLARWPWRWDVAAFLAANALAVWVVSGAEQTRTPVALYLTSGVWSILAGTALLGARHRTRAGLGWLVVGVVLLEVGAGRAGPGWLTLGLALAAALTTALAVATREPAHQLARRALQVTGMATAWGAAGAFVWWTRPATSVVVIVSALVAGMLTCALATARRYQRLGDDWAIVWGVPAVVTVGIAAVAAAQLADLGVGVAAAGGLALVAVAAAELAEPLDLAVLRDAVVGLLTAAVAIVLVTAVAGPATIAVVAGCVGFAATLTVAALAWRRPTSAWTRPMLEAATVAALAALGAGYAALPAVDLLVAALALAGAEAAVLGLVLGRLDVLGVSPVLLCAAWLLFASDALQGNPQWFTVPIGVTLLVVEGLVRAARRAHGLDPHVPEIVAVDLLGMAFVVGASLVQIATTSAWYSVLAIAFGVAITEWAVATKVLHRAWFGVGTVTAALVIVVALPIVEFVPHLEGAGLWITIAGLGLAALIAAGFLEAGKRRAQAELQHLRSLTSAWER